MNRITKLRVSGFKSIKDQEIELRPLNVLIGANGSGKSNLVAFFKMLNFAVTGSLQVFISRNGGANSLLHYGARQTQQIRGEFVFETEAGINTYWMQLAHAAEDILIYTEETVRFQRHGHPGTPKPISLGVGHKETALKKPPVDNTTVRTIRWLMDRWEVFQFHDTSPQANIRQNCYIHENHYLRSDAGNLAAVLYRLKTTEPSYYERIVSTIRLGAPFFGDFELQPLGLDPDSIRLDWREHGSKYLFGPHQVSDGTLRFMALTTLLLLPESMMPSVIVIDEPELGLHPFAIGALGSLLLATSEQVQIITSTQSTELVDQFQPEDILVVDRVDGESKFSRYTSEGLAEWLEDYTLSDLWKKNVLGGRPGR